MGATLLRRWTRAAATAALCTLSLAWAQPARVAVQTGHTLGVTALAFTPDARTAVSAGGDRFLKFWDLASRRELRSVAMDLRFGISHIAVSPDGKMLAVLGFLDRSGSIYLFDVATGALRQTLRGHTADVNTIAFSPDGRTLASGGSDDNLCLWDLPAGKLRTGCLRHPGFPSSVASLAFAPDGRTLAFGREAGTVTWFDVAAGKPLRSERGHTGTVAALAFSADGRLLASGGSDKSIRLWQAQTGEAVATIAATQADLGVRTLAFLSDGRRLLAGSYDEAVLWDLASRSALHTIAKAQNAVLAPDGSVLMAGGPDGSIAVWEAATARPAGALLGRGEPLLWAGFEPGGQRLAAIDAGSRMTVWDIAAGRQRSSFRGRSQPVGVAFRADGEHVLASERSDDKEIYTRWDTGDARELGRFEMPQAHLSDIGADWRTVAYVPLRVLNMATKSSPKDLIHLWDTASGRALRTLDPGGEVVECLRWSPDGRLLAAGVKRRILLWDAASGRLLRTLTGHTDDVSHVEFSADGRSLVSGSADKSLKVWDVAAGTLRVTLQGHADRARGAFSPDGRWLVSGGADHAVKLWDLQTGRELRTLAGHGHWVEHVGFAPDGKTVFSASSDKTLRLWRAADGAELARFIAVGEDGWVVMTPEGYFNASSYEAADAINVVHGDSVHGVAEFWDVFFRPDLVRRRLAGEDIRAATGGVTFETALRTPPPRDIDLAFAGPAPQGQAQVRVGFRVADAGGGIGEVRVFHNGKLVASDGLYKDAAGRGSDGPVLVALSATRICRPLAGFKGCAGEVVVEAVAGEDNEISVVAFNAPNTLQGLPRRLAFTSTLARREPRLWIVAVGINEFSSAQDQFGRLSNAARDAEDFVRVYARQAQGLFKPEHIHVMGTGADGRAPLRDAQATRAAILAQLDRVAQAARPQDSFVWFVASHGTTDRHGVFGIVPHDVGCAGERCIDKRNLIGSNDILDKSKAIRAMSQLMIFDTCQSGALDDRISGLYDARMATLARNMGLHLYASAQATEHASDSDGRGNGLFTGQLLRGLAHEDADRNRDAVISIVELGDYARRLTVALTGGPGSRGAKLAGGPAPQVTRKATQTPVIMHFGKDGGLARLARPSEGATSTR